MGNPLLKTSVGQNRDSGTRGILHIPPVVPVGCPVVPGLSRRIYVEGEQKGLSRDKNRDKLIASDRDNPPRFCLGLYASYP